MPISPYDSATLYDTAAEYNGGTGMGTWGNAGWLAVLNQLAGTKNLGENAAANNFAYGKDKGNGLLQALNDAAGTSGLGLDAVCNVIGGTSGLSAVAALNAAAANAAP